jgi:pantoate--beta-alanine ligase
MEIINRRQRMCSVARKVRRDREKTIGFVPTMGALHDGHLSLVREARRMSDMVVVSIFVNPTQFGPTEDFARYPRDLTHDAGVLAEMNVDYVFAPVTEEIYPKSFRTFITVEGVSDILEGAARPGHFRGVATVVALLLNVVRPDFAFFGQKDAQQTVVVKRLVNDLAINTEIVICPTVRETSGLALSSRNAFLSAEDRSAAAILQRGLQRAKSAFDEGERSAEHLCEIVREVIAKEPRAHIEYVSANDADTLDEIERIDHQPVLISLAARFHATRLIDNIVINSQK